MLMLQRLHVFFLGLATLSVAGLTTPAAATTNSITPQTWAFLDPTFSNNFHLNTTHPYQVTAAIVGELRPTIYQAVNGDYAAILEFALPTLPSGAILTSLSVAVVAFDGRLGDVQLSTYVAATAAGNPARLFTGKVITNSYKPLRTGTTTDLTGVYAVSYLKANAGSYLRFSVRETNTHCGSFDCRPYDSLGSNSDPTDYPLPILTLAYNVPPPPPATPVPEPSSQTLMIAGLRLVGAAVWLRSGSYM